MNALLWKDYRHNRPLLIGVAIFLLLPYFVALTVAIVQFIKADASAQRIGWNGFLFGGAAASVTIATAACAFIAGNAVAGEKSDRSAEFLAYLPIPRRRAISSKAILAAGACILALLVNCGLLWLTMSESDSRSGHFQLALIVGATAILVFGVAWLFSVLLSSPSNAAAIGLGSVFIVGAVMALLEHLQPVANEENEGTIGWYIGICLVLGIGGFAAGVISYLRRP